MSRNATMEDRIAELEDRVEQLRADNRSLETILARRADEVEHLREERNRLATECRRLQEEINLRRVAMNAADTEIKRLCASEQDLGREILRLRSENAAKCGEVAVFLDGMAERVARAGYHELLTECAADCRERAERLRK